MGKVVLSTIVLIICITYNVIAASIFVGASPDSKTVSIGGSKYVPVFYHDNRNIPSNVEITREYCGNVEFLNRNLRWSRYHTFFVENVKLPSFINTLLPLEWFLGGTDYCDYVKVSICVKFSPIDHTCGSITIEKDAKCRTSYSIHKRQWNGMPASCVFEAPCFNDCIVDKCNDCNLSGNRLVIHIDPSYNIDKTNTANILCGDKTVKATCSVRFISIPDSYSKVNFTIGKPNTISFHAGKGYKFTFKHNDGDVYQFQRTVASKYSTCKVLFAVCSSGGFMSPLDFVNRTCQDSCQCSFSYGLVTIKRWRLTGNESTVYIFNTDPNTTYDNLSSFTITKPK